MKLGMKSGTLKQILSGLPLTLVMAAAVLAQTVPNDDTVLKQIIIFGRHSVRAPVVPPAS